MCPELLILEFCVLRIFVETHLLLRERTPHVVKQQLLTIEVLSDGLSLEIDICTANLIHFPINNMQGVDSVAGRSPL